MSATIDDFEAWIAARIDERIDRAIGLERAKWQAALHEQHCQLLEVVRTAVEKTLDRSEQVTTDAIQRLLANTESLLQQFDAKVRLCLEEDRARMFGLTNARTVN